MANFLNWFSQIGFWGWFAFGLMLVILEILAPSFVFLWLGIAAGVVGLLVLLMPGLPWEYQWLLFAVFAIVSIVISRRYFAKNPGVEDNLTLNKRGAQYVGRSFTLSEPIRNGRGKIHVDDTQWTVEGPDLEAGENVTVTGTDGVLLIVAPKQTKD